MKWTNPTTQAGYRYIFELGLASAVYLAVTAGSAYGLAHGVEGIARIAVAAAPVVPILGMSWAIVRWLIATDEYHRTTIVICMAIAGGLTALLTVTYGVLQNAGLPPLNASWTWIAFMVIWGLSKPIVERIPR
jgi:hypothetical protein